MKQISLDIAMDYPIYWKIERILRDLIQNFYDSIGMERFHEEFEYSYEKDESNQSWEKSWTIRMKTYGHPFHYEWLVYIGGSTKTKDQGKYIGKYGEGFKLCMLALLRSYHCNVTMHSQNWMISPMQYLKTIEGQNIPMLGYNYWEVEDDGWTELVISGLTLPFHEEYILNEAMLHFLYPENPLFGRRLSGGMFCEVYERSGMPIPCKNKKDDFQGILYCNYLARGRLPFDLNLHIILKETEGYYVTYSAEEDTRSREIFSPLQVFQYLSGMAEWFEPEVSYHILIHMRNYWNDRPLTVKNSKLSWYYLICQLVRNVNRCDEIKKRFQKEYSNLAYIERKSNDRFRNRLIREAEIWSRANSAKELVNPIFRLLGAESLVDTYQKRKKKKYNEPDDVEGKLAELLFKAFEGIVPAPLYEKRPVLLLAEEEEWGSEMQFAVMDRKKNKLFRIQRYRIEKVVMKSSDFTRGKFRDSFVKLSDIILHTFGTSRSETLNAVLTEFGSWCIENRTFLRQQEERWDQIIEEGYAKNETEEK